MESGEIMSYVVLSQSNYNKMMFGDVSRHSEFKNALKSFIKFYNLYQDNYFGIYDKNSEIFMNVDYLLNEGLIELDTENNYIRIAGTRKRRNTKVEFLRQEKPLIEGTIRRLVK